MRNTFEMFGIIPPDWDDLISSLNRISQPGDYLRWQTEERQRILRSAQEDINEEWHFTLRDMDRAWDHKIKIAMRRMDRRIAEIGTPDLPMKPKGRRVSRAEIEKYQKEHRG